MEHSGESIVRIIGGSSPALCHKFFGKKGGVVFKPCNAECFWSESFMYFHKIGGLEIFSLGIYQ